MKFLMITGHVGDSYISFKFTPHNSREVCCGDQVWSDGENVEIYEDIDNEVLADLMSTVDNKRAFRGALLICGFNV